MYNHVLIVLGEPRRGGDHAVQESVPQVRRPAMQTARARTD